MAPRAQIVVPILQMLLIGIGMFLPGGSLGAEDAVETGSVIPLGKKSAEQVGTVLAVKTLREGSSSRVIRKAAVNEFPTQFMTRQSQIAANEILNNISLYRRLPTIQLSSDRRCYEFFANHPDVAVSIWRAMKISQVSMTKKSPTSFDTDTKDGTCGTVQVLLNTPGHYIVTCQGEFKSPAIKKPIQAVAMMHLKPTFAQDGTITHQLDLYVSFPNSAVEAIARLISPVSNRIADRNFEEVSLFVEMMSLAMSRQPGWVEQISHQLEGIQTEDADKLLQLTAQIYVDALKAEKTVSGTPGEIGTELPVTTQTVSLPESTIRK